MALMIRLMTLMIVMTAVVARCQSGQRSRQLVIIAVAHSVHLGRPVYFARLVSSGPIKLLSPTQ
jgi:hypothetical protein